MKDYLPNPLLFDASLLPEEVVGHIELMAKNVHEVWAFGRMQASWKHGYERNDERKEHPSIIDYESLTEEEKEYDRRTVIATISYLIEYGFEIKKVENDG